MDILLSYIWLLDETKEMKTIKKEKYFEITKNNYMSFLILFLKIGNSSKSIEDSCMNKIQDPIINNKENNSNKKNEKKFDINPIYQKVLFYVKNQYIFFNLSLIMVKSNIIHLLDLSEIGRLEWYFWEENKDKENRNSDYKKTLYLSYLQIFLSFYFSKESKSKSPNKTNENETILDFLQKESKDSNKFNFLKLKFKFLNKLKLIICGEQILYRKDINQIINYLLITEKII